MLASHYRAKGDLELMFIRQIAASQVTCESLQRNIDTLLSAPDPNDIRIERFSRTKAREQRAQILALKELKDLQHRRNIMERFPDQTRDCAPLADHSAHVGQHPRFRPIPLQQRGRLHPPLDNSRWRDNEPDPTTLAKGLPDIRCLVPDVVVA